MSRICFTFASHWDAVLEPRDHPWDLLPGPGLTDTGVAIHCATTWEGENRTHTHKTAVIENHLLSFVDVYLVQIPQEFLQ